MRDDGRGFRDGFRTHVGVETVQSEKCAPLLRRGNDARHFEFPCPGIEGDVPDRDVSGAEGGLEIVFCPPTDAFGDAPVSGCGIKRGAHYDGTCSFKNEFSGHIEILRQCFQSILPQEGGNVVRLLQTDAKRASGLWRRGIDFSYDLNNLSKIEETPS